MDDQLEKLKALLAQAEKTGQDLADAVNRITELLIEPVEEKLTKEVMMQHILDVWEENGEFTLGEVLNLSCSSAGIDMESAYDDELLKAIEEWGAI